MGTNFHYGTVTEAIEKLRAEGFTTDFTLSGKYFVSPKGKHDMREFEIVDAYRYEGDSDPGDEAVVYALKSKSGLKGILVMGYGISSDHESFEEFNKLKSGKK